MSTERCPICDTAAEVTDRSAKTNITGFECVRCGKFQIGGSERKKISSWTNTQKANLSGWIQENIGTHISKELTDSLSKLATPTVGEKANKLLLFLAKQHPKPGEKISLRNPEPNFEGGKEGRYFSKRYASIGWAQDREELDYLFGDYLENEKGLVSLNGFTCEITPPGWNYIEKLQRGNPESKMGFIAMWFNDTMKDAETAIHRGIEKAGYDPKIVNREEHNNKIDDEIIALIRRSKFVVADFTGHRGGVYFEAGFAMGLGLPVIWLCREDEIDKLHFDTRQYNHIPWTVRDLKELPLKIQNRIEATIGKGPLKPNQ